MTRPRSPDLPIVTPEDVLRSGARGNNASGKAAVGYLALEHLLGDAGFRAASHAFIACWHGRPRSRETSSTR